MQKGDAMDAAERSERIPDIVIITGMSGSGRTQAMHVFEDMGYFCIDNLPPRLIAQLAELVGINTGVGRHLAVTCDLRSQGLFDELLDAVAALDPVTAKQVMQDFVRINQELGISILLNIHHVELALEYADRIIGIRAGKIVYDGPSDKVDQAVLDSIYGEDTGTEASV